MNNKPNYLTVSAVRTYRDEHGEERSHWTKIGAAFPNTKGGFRLKLDLIPTDPSLDIVVMPPRDRADEDHIDP